MSLIDEIKQQDQESYDKWFERWYKKENLEKEIKQAAMEGYKGFIIDIEPKVPYLKRRLCDDRTTKRIEEKLGEGFTVYYFRNARKFGDWTTGYDEKIHIKW